MLPDPDDILCNNIIKNCYYLAKKYKFEMIRYNLYLGNNKIFFENLLKNLTIKPIYKPELSTYLFYGIGSLRQIDFNVANKFINIKSLNQLNNFFLNQYMINYEDGIINHMLYRTANSFFF